MPTALAYQSSFGQAEGNYDGRPMPALHPFFFDANFNEVVVQSGLGGGELQYPLSVWISERAVTEKHPENRGIRALARDTPVLHPWFGVVVVLKYAGSRRASFTHMTEDDLRFLSAYFVSLQH